MQEIMLNLSGEVTLFRNNVGAGKLAGGQFVRFGVGGKGGSDLLGWKSVEITPAMVGERVAVFVAIETKVPGGHVLPEQEHFIKVVVEAGGLAGIARSTEDAQDIIAT